MTKPADKCNHAASKYISLGPHFRIDADNPQFGERGKLSYLLYSYTDDEDKHAEFLSADGTWSVFNDRSIEIVGGAKNEAEKGQDVTIVAKTGELVIQADGNGAVRIKGPNIVIEATEDLDLKAGRNITFTSDDKVVVTSNQMDIAATSGNVAKGFAIDLVSQAFSGSFVGADVLLKLIGAASPIKLPFLG